MIDQITPSRFQQWVASNDQATPLVLDVRETWEFQMASIKPLSQTQAFDLLHIPMNEIPQRLAELPQDRAIACLCHHGMRSMNVACWLQAQGFNQVVNLAGGIAAWSQELDPSVPPY
jgi:rhodanese-related sulfurtransferase